MKFEESEAIVTKLIEELEEIAEYQADPERALKELPKTDPLYWFCAANLCRKKAMECSK